MDPPFRAAVLAAGQASLAAGARLVGQAVMPEDRFLVAGRQLAVGIDRGGILHLLLVETDLDVSGADSRVVQGYESKPVPGRQPDRDRSERRLIGAGVVAFIAQWLLTLAERPLWRWILRRKDGRFILASVVVTGIDGLLNAAGLYPYIGALTGSNLIAMIADVAKVDPTIGKPAAFVLAGAIGLLVAALAEFYWELD